MALTYSPAGGVVVDSPIVYETLGSQSGAGSDEVILATAAVTPSTHANYGGQIGDGSSGQGPGDTYVGRLLIVRPGTATEQLKLCIAETDQGATILLQVHEDWDTVPASGDYFAASYTMDDVDNGLGSGVTYSAKTAAFIFSNKLDIGNGTDFAMIQLSPAESMEINDSAGATDPDLEVNNNGMFCAGYLFAGQAVGGGYITSDQNSDGEYTWGAYSGCYMRLYDTDLKININDITLQWEAGADIQIQSMKNFQFTYDCDLQDGEYISMRWYGAGSANDFVRIAEETTIDTWILYQTGGFTTISADTSVESLTIRDVVFIDNVDNITINSNKSWFVINPTWGVLTYNDALLNWLTTTDNYVYDQRSIDAIVQEADGTKLQNAVVVVFEGTILGDLVIEEVTDVNGEANSAFTYLLHETNSLTTTYGQHALRVDKWLYFPFVATQESDEFFDGVVVLGEDDCIVQITQATALSEGSGITWNDEALLTTTTTTTTTTAP